MQHKRAGEYKSLSGAFCIVPYLGVTASPLPPPDSWIKRKHLATGGIETIADLAAEVTAVRYEATTGTLFFLEGGTQGNEFKDGALKAIMGLGAPPIP